MTLAGVPLLLGDGIGDLGILGLLRRAKTCSVGIHRVPLDRKFHWLRHRPQSFAKGSLFSPRDFLSEDENDKKQNTQSSDESFEPYPEKK